VQWFIKARLNLPDVDEPAWTEDAMDFVKESPIVFNLGSECQNKRLGIKDDQANQFE
jgi:hypothetical protein